MAVMRCVAAALLLQLAVGLIIPEFQDVTSNSGFLTWDTMDKRVAEHNKYWGATIGDFDKDGHYDLLLSNHANNPEVYYYNENGTYDYKNPRLKLRDIHSTAAADMDNDGYLDLVVTQGGSNGNQVTGFPFILKTKKNQSIQKGFSEGMGFKNIPFRGRATGFLDVDGDGDLDLLYVNRRNKTATYAHMLFENMGDGTFEFRNNTGMEEVNAAWFQIVDVNNDSYPDLLFMKFGGVELYLGTGEFRYEYATHLIPKASLPRMKNCRAVAEIDIDNDGKMDLYFARGTKRRGRHDVLLRNTPSGYVDITKAAGLRNGVAGKHFHVTTGDFNNDGFMDMYISKMNFFHMPRDNDLMYLNNGDHTFTTVEASQIGTYPEHKLCDGDNALAFDYNNDGLIDILSGDRNSTWKLYENTKEMGDNMNYVLVRVGEPRGQFAEPNWFTRKAMGALVKVTCDGVTHMQRVGSPGQSHSQSYMDTIHFGLGRCVNIESIVIEYQHNVVVTRDGPMGANGIIEVGMYYPCGGEPMLTRECDVPMAACTDTPCAEGEACETIELVREKCDEQRCTMTENDVLVCTGGCLKKYCPI